MHWLLAGNQLFFWCRLLSFYTESSTYLALHAGFHVQTHEADSAEDVRWRHVHEVAPTLPETKHNQP